jgi:hypothetical protein
VERLKTHQVARSLYCPDYTLDEIAHSPSNGAGHAPEINNSPIGLDFVKSGVPPGSLE